MPTKKKGKKGKKGGVKSKKDGLTNSAGKVAEQLTSSSSYKIERPPKYGERLLELLKTHKVDEKELYGRKISTKSLEHLTSSEIQDLALVFDLFDTNEDGYLGVYEVQKALKVLGFKVGREKIQQLVQESSTKGMPALNLNEFLDLIISQQGDSRDVYEEIMAGFRLMDVDKKGMLTVDNLKEISLRHNVNLSKQDLEEMIQEADLNGDGCVDKDEFVKIMLKTNIF